MKDLRAKLGEWRISWWQALASVLILFLALAPFIWMFVVSLTPEEEHFAQGVRYFPDRPTIANYFRIYTGVPFGRAFVNSIIVAVSVTSLTIVVSSLAAYGFARFRFAGRQALIICLLLIYMLPSVVLLVPLLIIFRSAGLINTYLALILAESTHAVPFAVWLLTGYFQSLPAVLEEAALVDGATPVSVLIRVVMPLAIPGLIAAGLFVFIASWNNFLFAFMLTSGEQVRTLPVLLRMFIGGEAGLYWGAVMAGSVMSTVPVALAFLFFQRYLMRGLAAGAVKG
jgi:ABC-type glycerol-3-phosphate transport system permease component